MRKTKPDSFRLPITKEDERPFLKLKEERNANQNSTPESVIEPEEDNGSPIMLNMQENSLSIVSEEESLYDTSCGGLTIKSLNRLSRPVFRVNSGASDALLHHENVS